MSPKSRKCVTNLSHTLSPICHPPHGHEIATEMSQDCPAVSPDVLDVSPDVTEMAVTLSPGLPGMIIWVHSEHSRNAFQAEPFRTFRIPYLPTTVTQTPLRYVTVAILLPTAARLSSTSYHRPLDSLELCATTCKRLRDYAAP